LPPLLIALGGSVMATGPGGERTIAADALFSGYYETALAGDELITEVRVPAQGRRRAVYLKCTTRSVDDWPAVGVAVSLDVEDDVIRDASIVVSAATEMPTRLAGVAAVLQGASASDAPLTRLREAAGDEVSTIADARGSAAYKRELVRVYVARAVRQCLAIQ